MLSSLTGYIAPLLDGDARSPPLYLRLQRALRDALRAGRIRDGERLPSSRALASELGVARKTVEAAYAGLETEGLLERRVGDGSYARPRESAAEPALPARRALSRDMQAAGGWMQPCGPRPFVVATPALDAFPVATWQRLLQQRIRRSGDELLAYGDPQGYPPLREAIAQYVAAVRGVRCTAAQVIVVASSQIGLELVARLALKPRDAAWIEEPGYMGARVAFTAAGARVVPVAVDAQGLDVARGLRLAPRARIAHVTPSHQFPTGVTLSLARRRALLDWAVRANAWILEDDYDHEFRHRGRPIVPLQALDTTGRVFYLGTFTNTMFPGLRLAYLVAPAAFVEPLVQARATLDGGLPTLPQAVLYDFIDQGHFAAHVMRMARLYRARCNALEREVAARLAGRLTLRPADTGVHVLGEFDPPMDDRAFATRATSLGLDLTPVAHSYVQQPPPRPGLVLGYASLTPQQIRDGVAAIASLFAMEDTGRSA